MIVSLQKELEVEKKLRKYVESKYQRQIPQGNIDKIADELSKIKSRYNF